MKLIDCEKCDFYKSSSENRSGSFGAYNFGRPHHEIHICSIKNIKINFTTKLVCKDYRPILDTPLKKLAWRISNGR